MSALGTLQRMLHDFSDRRARARTRRIVGALPPEICKDIGWPGHFPGHEHRRGADHIIPYRR